MTIFILVHGTFSKSAKWPVLQKALAEAVSAMGECPEFREVRWTGKNRAIARQDAASSIRNLLKNLKQTSVDKKVFLIGHSHGGSAISYFLKNYPEEAKLVSGCAFLSTPFVAIRPRQGNIPILSMYYSLYVLSISSFSILMTKIGVGMSLMSLSAFSLLFYMTLSGMFKRSRDELSKVIQQQTANLPYGEYLFLRCSGDEAAAGLSSLQFMAWVGVKLGYILKFINPYFESLESGSFLKRLLLMIILSFTASGPIVIVGLNIQVYRILILIGSFSNLDAITLLAISVILVFSITTLFAFLCVVSASVIFFSQAITCWAFGWTPLFTGLIIELAIEPLPFGTHALTHIDWTVTDSNLIGITHSWTYAHPAAVKCLTDWVLTVIINDSLSTTKK